MILIHGELTWRLLKNHIFDELEPGDSAGIKRTLTLKDIKLFSIMSGDVNPAHVDADYAKDDMFHKIIAQGMWGASLISTVLGTELPGPDIIYLDQTLKFTDPVIPGDTVFLYRSTFTTVLIPLNLYDEILKSFFFIHHKDMNYENEKGRFRSNTPNQYAGYFNIRYQ